MIKLREINGDNLRDLTEDKTVVVDGERVAQEKLQELQSRQDIRLAEVKPNEEFRTLHRLRG